MLGTVTDIIADTSSSDANWAINDKPELWSALQNGATPSGNWAPNQLTQSGEWIRNSIRSSNSGGGDGDGGGGCAGDEDNCRSSRCCATPGKQCFEKDEHWASCRDSCTPGINPNDPPQYQTPWSCVPLSRRLSLRPRRLCSPPAPTPSPSPTPASGDGDGNLVSKTSSRSLSAMLVVAATCSIFPLLHG